MLVLFLCFGMLRAVIASHETEEDMKSFSPFFEKTVVFEGVIIQEPERGVEKQRMVLDHIEVMQEGEKYSLQGKVFVTTRLYPKYVYADRVTLRCRLESPQPFDGFSYEKYLAMRGIVALCSYPDTIAYSSSEEITLHGVLFSVKSFLVSRLFRSISEPHASFLSGLLIGARQGMDPEVLDDFRKSGVTHIIALSGYNISIIISTVVSVLPRIGISRKRLICVIGVLVGMFILLSGAPSSIVRAGIMAGVATAAMNLGRTSHAKNALLYSVAIMLMINPMILLYDIGFQLSVTATYGLIVISPILKKTLKFLPEFFALRDNATATIAAMMMSTPLILFTFGSFSFTALLVNVLILPAIPFAMFFGFLSLATSVFSLHIARLISLFTWLLLEYVLKVTHFTAAFHGSFLENIKFGILALALSYGVVFFLLNRYEK